MLPLCARRAPITGAEGEKTIITAPRLGTEDGAAARRRVRVDTASRSRAAFGEHH